MGAVNENPPQLPLRSGRSGRVPRCHVGDPNWSTGLSIEVYPDVFLKRVFPPLPILKNCLWELGLQGAVQGRCALRSCLAPPALTVIHGRQGEFSYHVVGVAYMIVGLFASLLQMGPAVCASTSYTVRVIVSWYFVARLCPPHGR